MWFNFGNIYETYGENIKVRKIFDLTLLENCKKYTNGECSTNRTKNYLTRELSYLVAGVMHSFFYKNFDSYKILCPFYQKMRNNYFWLESKCRNYFIDLTEEQYLKEGITNIRHNGQITKSIGHSYGNKTKYMAYIIATRNSPDAVNINDIKSISYIK